MLANGIKQAATGGTGALTLAVVGSWPQFAANYSTGVNGDPIPYAITRDSDGVGIEWGWGHLSDASTFVRDRILVTWSGTTYNKSNPVASDLSAGGPYTLSVSDNASLRVLPPAGTDPGVGAVRYLMGGQWNVSPAANYAMAAGVAVVTPYRLDVSGDCSGISNKVNGAASTGATKNARFSLYHRDRNGRIGNLIAETASVSVGTTGVKSGLFPATIRLDSGWYFIVQLTDGNPNIAGTNAAGGAGLCPMWGVPGGDVSGRYVVATKAMPYVDTGPCFPATFGSSGITYGVDWAGAVPCPTLMMVS